MNCQAPCDPPCEWEASTKGLCDAHYRRLLRRAPIDTPVRRKLDMQPTCTAPCDPPCDRVAKCNGLCNAHLERLRNRKPINVPVSAFGGRTGRKRSEEVRTCSANCDPPCRWPPYALGLCHSHYARWLDGSDIDVPVERIRGRKDPLQCRVCGRPAETGDICRTCRMRERRRKSKGGTP